MSINLATKKEHLIAYNEHGLFWDREGKSIVVNYPDLIIWLTENGYFKYGNELVKVTDNVVCIIKLEDLKAVFLSMIEPEVKKLFYEKVKTIFDPKGGLFADMKWLSSNFIKDTKTQTWLFYTNTAVCIRANHGIEPVAYNMLDGYIWESAIVNRQFHLNSFADSDAEKFVKILGGDDYDKLCRILGYAISRYKDPTFLPAIVFNEDIDSENEGESNGRSGKGLITNFISKVRKILPFDGKSFNAEKTHKFQNLTIDTNIIAIQDVKKNFPFSNLFSMLTDGVFAEPKNKPEIHIPFEDSPKFIIQSNFIVGTSDGSSKARRLTFSVVKYFSNDYTPFDEFKRQFFFDWDAKEWSKFDNFMANCALEYLLDVNHSHMQQVTKNNKERQIKADTNKEFIDMMDTILANNFLEFASPNLKVFDKFNYEGWQANMCQPKPMHSMMLFIDREKLVERTISRTKLKFLTSHKIIPWLKIWAESRNVTIDTRWGDSLEILVQDFENRVKRVDDEMPF